MENIVQNGGGDNSPWFYATTTAINDYYDKQPELKSDKVRLRNEIYNFVKTFSNISIIDKIKFNSDIKTKLTEKFKAKNLSDEELITAIMNKVHEEHEMPQTKRVVDNNNNILTDSEQQNKDLAEKNKYAREYVNTVKAIFENQENTDPYLNSMDIIINPKQNPIIEKKFDDYDNKPDNDINKITSIDVIFYMIITKREINLFLVLLYLLNRKIVNIETNNNPENLDLEYYKTLLGTLKEKFFAIGTNENNLSPDIIPSKNILLGYLKDILKKKINAMIGGAGKKRCTKRSKAPTSKRTRGKKYAKKSTKKTAKKMRS